MSIKLCSGRVLRIHLLNLQIICRAKQFIKYLKNLVQKHYEETLSEASKKIINNFDQEVKKFYQICPKEIFDKLENPISNKQTNLAS